jgi:hypothetical protein
MLQLYIAHADDTDDGEGGVYNVCRELVTAVAAAEAHRPTANEEQ